MLTCAMSLSAIFSGSRTSKSTPSKSSTRSMLVMALDHLGSITDLVHWSDLQVFFGQSHNSGFKRTHRFWTLRAGDEVAAGQVDIIGKAQHNRITIDSGLCRLWTVNMGNRGAASVIEINSIANLD